MNVRCKRHTPWVALILFSLLLLSGCHSLAPPVVEETAEPVVTLWHALPPEEAEVLQGIADEWATRADGNARVELLAMPDEAALHQRLLAAIQTNMTPALSFVRPPDIAAYADADAIRPLDAYLGSVQGEESAASDEYFSHFLEGLRYPRAGNALYAWPIHRYQTLLFVNLTRFEAAGGELPLSSWEELVETCAAFRAQGGERCLATSSNGDIAVLWLWNHGGEVVDSTGKHPTFQSSGGRAVMEWLAALRAVEGLYISSSSEARRTAFTSGDVLFTFDSTANIHEYEEAIGSEFEMTVVPPPASEGEPVTLATGGNVALFRTDPATEELARDFMQFWISPEVNERWAEAIGAYPVRRGALEALQAKWPERSRLRTASKWLSNCRSTPLLARWPQIEQVLSQSMLKTANGSETPEEALAEAARRIQGLLDEQ